MPLLGFGLGSCRRIALPPQREFKLLSLAVSLSFMTLMLLLFLTQQSEVVSRFVISGAWIGSLFAVPLLRAAVRRRFGNRSWWGVPLIFIGSEKCEEVRLEIERKGGLYPMVRLDAFGPDGGFNPELGRLAARWPDAFVLLLPDVLREDRVAELVQYAENYFATLLLLPDLLAENPAEFSIQNLGCAVVLGLRQNLRDRRRLRFKRILDTALTVCGILLLAPTAVLLALCIKLDSHGPCLYRQERIGRGGRRFQALKFRTMVVDAEDRLAACLARDESLRREWEQNHKIKDDPRLTRIGALLRKSSMDELPQLWNVLAGEMSLVGPRPIIEAEREKYGRVFEEYVRVRPGLTGLWQISGRNDTGYERRVRLDQYYVRNWSVWFDIWILAKTVPAVLRGRGAY